MIFINKLLCKDQKPLPKLKNVKYFTNIKEVEFKPHNKLFGTIRDYRMFAPYKSFDVSDWITYFKHVVLNQKSWYKQVWQLNDSDIGFFCRSNSGKKVWAGQVLDVGLLQIIRDKCQPDDLMFLAEPKEIEHECRIWIYNNEIIELCNYVGAKKPSINIINKFLALSPYNTYVLDLAYYENAWKLIELNGFFTSGFYSANINKIIRAAKK